MLKTPRLEASSTAFRATLGGLIGLVAGLVMTLLRPVSLVENVELRFLDLQTTHFTLERPPDDRIVLSEILEEDVAAIRAAFNEMWPWNLELTSYPFKIMAEAGVKAVVVDVYQFDRGAGPDDFADGTGVARAPDTAGAQRLEIEAELGEIFGSALGEIKGVALAFDLTDHPVYEVEARVTPALVRLGLGRVQGGPDGMVRRGADFPVRRVLEGADLLGFATQHSDGDGVVRRAPVLGRWSGKRVLSLPLAGLLLATGEDAVVEDGILRVGEVGQPLNEDGTFLVNFHPDTGRTYPRVSPAQLMEWARQVYMEGAPLPAEAREALEGKIVVWGVNIPGVEDIVTAPMSGKFHGPEYQATILDNLLHGDGRVRASRLYNTVMLLIVTIVLGVLSGAMQKKWVLHLMPFAVIVAGMLFAVWRFTQGTALDVFTPFLGVTLTWGGTTLEHMLTAGRRNRWLQGTFSRYLAPSIIEALKEDPTLLELGGRRRELTILFSDVAGFTSISESIEPEQLVELLNRYLTMHSASVMAERGVVDKFEGDAVMAFFGDPVETDQHAVQACRAACDVIRKLPDLRPVWEGMGLKGFSIRIGLNSGNVVVGNMGSDQRFDYTCMGDAVNLASRLESANKAFSSVIMIGPQTYEEARDLIVARPLCGLVVVGKSVPKSVYELLSMREDASEDLVRHVGAFAEAQEAARGGDLEAARAALARAAALRPDDGPTAWFGGLLDRMEAGEEPTPWSGVVVMKGK